MTTNTFNSAAAPDWKAAQAAIEKGDIESVRAYLDAGGEVNQQGGSGNMTLLMWAGFAQADDIAALLIERGADVNIIDDNCRGNALIWAVEAGSTNIVRLILDRKPDLDYGDSDGETALMYAGKGGHRQIAKLLLEKGANPDVTDTSGRTALQHVWDAENRSESQQLSHTDVAKVIQEYIDRRAEEQRKLDEARAAAQQLTADAVDACRNGATGEVKLSRKLYLKPPVSAG